VLAGDWGDGRGSLPVASLDGDIYLNTLVLEHRFSDRVTYVLQHDLGANSGLGPENAQWYAIVQYLTYEIDSCWQFGGRLEWFRDDDGVRIGEGANEAGAYYEATLGLNWKPHPNITVRPELRWDWFDGTAFPYDDGTEKDLFTGGIDAIFTY
jgi:hypothetical protein